MELHHQITQVQIVHISKAKAMMEILTHLINTNKAL